ncbi:MAG: hypothetical protein K2H01_11730, partial [Ruminococcus sp.]|nr:hypothetical protein [Ruminococcus sp.]
CPNCGHTWTRKEDELVYGQADEEYEENADEMAAEFDKALSYFLDDTSRVTQSAKTTSDFMTQMNQSAQLSSPRISGAFHFLAALVGLFALKDNDFDEDENRQIRWVAHSQIKQAVSLGNTDEYRLIELLLQIKTTSNINELPKFIRKALACKVNDDSWLKKEYYQKSLVPDICFFKILLDMDNNEAIRDEDKIALWKALTNCPVNDYKMYANLQIYRKLSDSPDSFAFSCLYNAFNTKGFSLNKPKMEDVMYEQWLWAAEEYAECLCSGISNEIGKDKHRGIEILNTIADLGTQNPCLFARNFLGELAEQDGHLQKALTYYLKAGEIGSDCAMRVRKMIAETNDSSNSTAIESKSSDEENEYLSEFKACLAEGGEISKGERRLLEKLRIKLDISEKRAAELEQSLLTPQLTEVEEEYLAEYKECLAEDGTISAGERRLLNRLRDKLGISEERAKELEK